MDLRKLKKLIDLVEESGIAELEITEGEEKVRIVKHAVAAPPPAAYARPHGTPAASLTSGKRRSALDDDDEDEDLDADDEEIEQPGGRVIKSPMVGTFYRSETPSAAPYIEIGSTVRSGETLCGIEAMKQFNEVKSECNGTVTAILIENGQAVQFGQPLIVVA